MEYSLKEFLILGAEGACKDRKDFIIKVNAETGIKRYLIQAIIHSTTGKKIKSGKGFIEVKFEN